MKHSNTAKRIINLRAYMTRLELKKDSELIVSKKLQINHKIIICKKQIKKEIITQFLINQTPQMEDATENEYRVKIIDDFIVATLGK